jgi:hypothetical protein
MLNSNEVGVKYGYFSRMLGQNVDREGLHLGEPRFKFIIFPSVYKTMEIKDITVNLK